MFDWRRGDSPKSPFVVKVVVIATQIGVLVVLCPWSESQGWNQSFVRNYRESTSSILWQELPHYFSNDLESGLGTWIERGWYYHHW